MKWDALEDEPCSLARTVAVIGDRWSLLILRECFFESVGSRNSSHRWVSPDICLPSG
jgi:DNA-binding HxlR family transcriptional regulator